ncbi:hypothetical protein WMO79_06895 [Micrococcaceae bacterium Sec7.4]
MGVGVGVVVGVGVGLGVGIVTTGEGTAAVEGGLSPETDGVCALAAPVRVPNKPGWNIQTPTAATTTMVKTATLTAKSRWLQLLWGFAMCED